LLESVRWSRLQERWIGAAVSIVLGAVVASGLGCRMTMPERKIEAKIHPQKDIAANQNKVRLRMRALVEPMCAELEQAADAIIAGTTNASVKKAALRWKIEGVPALREALFQPDGLAALGDAWVLCNQMADYFDKGPGRSSLEEASHRAVEVCRRMEEDITQVAASITISGDVSRARAFAREWATEHPIEHSIAGRESTLSRVLERELAGSFSTGEVVGEMTTAVDDLNRRLDIYSAQLFRQARWEAELLRIELLEGLSLDKATTLAERAVRSSEQMAESIGQVAREVQRVAGVAEEAPKLLDSEREAALKALEDHFKMIFQFTRDERTAALEHITRERVAALKELREDLQAERLALSRELEQIGFRVVDHALWRVTQIMVAAIAGLYLLRRLFFRTPVDVRPPPSHLQGR